MVWFLTVTHTHTQMIDRLCVKVQDHLNSLRYSETDLILEDVKMAENFMKDARNSKTVIGRLYKSDLVIGEQLKLFSGCNCPFLLCIGWSMHICLEW